MSLKPLVTVSFITHNSEPFLEKALGSLIKQDYENFTILVSDNESTDNTEKIVNAFKEKYPNIVLRHNIPDRKPGKFYDGCYDNSNGCINSEFTKGEFVSIYHSDDIYEQGIVRKEVEFLLKNPEVAAVFTLGNIIDRNDNFLKKYRLPKELSGKNIFTFSELLTALLRHGNTFLITPTFMVRKKVLDELGSFSTEGLFGTSADLEMWLRIAKKYPIGIIDEPLIQRRVGGAGKQYNSKRTETAGFFKVMDYFLKNISEKDIDEKSKRQYQYQRDFDNTLLAVNFLIRDENLQAKNITKNPFSLKHFWAFFENISILRAKVLALQLFIFLGLNLGLGKYVGKILKRL